MGGVSSTITQAPAARASPDELFTDNTFDRCVCVRHPVCCRLSLSLTHIKERSDLAMSDANFSSCHFNSIKLLHVELANGGREVKWQSLFRHPRLGGSGRRLVSVDLLREDLWTSLFISGYLQAYIIDDCFWPFVLSASLFLYVSITSAIGKRFLALKSSESIHLREGGCGDSGEMHFDYLWSFAFFLDDVVVRRRLCSFLSSRTHPFLSINWWISLPLSLWNLNQWRIVYSMRWTLARSDASIQTIVSLRWTTSDE